MKRFHKKDINYHAGCYHEPRQGGGISEGLMRTVDDAAERTKRVMIDVYFLAKKNLALSLVTSLSQLLALQQVMKRKH